MRLVILSPTLPLPFGGADARWLHAAARELARRGIDVTFISCTEDRPEAVTAAHELATAHGYELLACPLILRESLPRRKTASLRRPHSELERVAELRSMVNTELARGYDVFHIEHLFTGWGWAGQPRSVLYLHHLEVVDWEDRSDLTMRERLTLLQMRRATRRLLRDTARVIVASDRLRSEVGRFRGGQACPIAPVGLDVSLYPLKDSGEQQTVGVIGSMHWYPSRSAAERAITQIWPAVRRQRPDARLVVAGWNAEKFLGHLLPVEGVDLIGPVDRPEEFFNSVSVVLYPPPRGSGMKIKVLEAMAYGVPVVSNDEGLEGIAIEPGVHAERATTDDDFIRAVVGLLDDPARRKRMARDARSLIEQQHSPGALVDNLLEAYAQLGLVS